MRPTRLIVLALLTCAAFAANAADRPLAEVLGGLKEGATVTVPAGAWTTSGIVLPPGATLIGAGHGATSIAVTGDIGVTVTGPGCVISDLAISGAADACVAVEQAGAGTMLARVRLSGALVGVRARGAARLRIEDAVLIGNRTGAALFGGVGAVIVNCTVADNTANGLFLQKVEGAAVFNTLFTGCPIAVVAQGEKDLRLDHNLYDGNDFVGKGRDVPMPSVYTWRSYTGYDRHSLMQPVAFADAATGDLRPVGALAWALDRTVVDGFGVASLGDAKAPAADIDGVAWRHGAPAIGAWQPAAITPARPADGEFAVTDGDGDTSVGLYRADGTQIALLVDMLALPKGTYRWWLPSRDWKQQAIAAGTYDLRVAESKLALRTIGTPGNTTSTAGTRDNYANDHTIAVAFDAKDRPVIAHPWSECYQNFRGFSPDLGVQRWAVPGCKDYSGMAIAGDGFLYGLNVGDDKNLVLRRIDLETGAIVPIKAGEYGTLLPRSRLTRSDGMTELDGRLYLADSVAGKLWHTPVGDPTFTDAIDLPGLSQPAADHVRHLVWVISGRKELLALAPDGAIRHRFTPPFGALAGLAVNKDRLAIASSTEGKVHVYDCSDPAKLTPVRTIGAGDGPYGPMQADRFLWQSPSDGGAAVGLALDSAGRLAVVDRLGAKLFSATGTVDREWTGIWAQYCETGPVTPDGGRLFLEKTYPMVLRLDPATKSWSYDQWLAKPVALGAGQVEQILLRGSTLYGIGKADGRLVLIRFDRGVGVVVAAFRRGGDNVLQRFAGPSEGLGDDANWKPVTGADGKPVACPVDFNSRLSGTADGALEFNTVFIPIAADQDGLPAWDWAGAKAVAPRIDPVDGKPGTFASPYNGVTAVDPATLPVAWADRFSDGSRVLNVSLRTQALIEAKAVPLNSSGFSNHAGSDLIGTDADGRMRWFRMLGDLKDPQGARVVGDLAYVTGVPTQELHIVDRDGMRVGICNVPGDLYWNGMWLDNPWQFNVFADAQGRHHVLYGNFNDATLWWMEVDGANAIRRASTPVAVSDGAAGALAALAPPPARPMTSGHRDTRVLIRKLTQPLPIDGSFDAWRAAIPTPQIIATPEAAGSMFTGAKDSSVLMRVAYLGTDLYVQALHFDDVTTDHQLSNTFYLQDCIEMALNSFVNGIKINASRVRDAGDLLVRDGWFIPGFAITPEAAPRHYRVVAGTDVPDRALLERITGEDLSACEVQVFTFRVTLDDALFLKRPEAKPEVASGKTMRIGLMVDDNDQHGTDLQHTLSWPATYGTFVSPEFSALGTFE